MQKEPARIITAIVGAVEAILVAAIAFGVDITPEQLSAVTAALLAVGGLVQAALIRARVFSPETVEEIARNVAAGRDAGLLDD